MIRGRTALAAVSRSVCSVLFPTCAVAPPGAFFAPSRQLTSTAAASVASPLAALTPLTHSFPGLGVPVSAFPRRFSTASELAAAIAAEEAALGDNIPLDTSEAPFTPGRSPFATIRRPSRGPLRPASAEWATETSAPLRERFGDAQLNYHFFAGSVPSRPLNKTCDELIADLSSARGTLSVAAAHDVLPWLYPTRRGSDVNLDSVPLTEDEVEHILGDPAALGRYVQVVHHTLRQLGVSADIPGHSVSTSRAALRRGQILRPPATFILPALIASLRDTGHSEFGFLVLQHVARSAAGDDDLLPVFTRATTEWAQHLAPEEAAKLTTLVRYWAATRNHAVTWVALENMRKEQVYRSVVANTRAKLNAASSNTASSSSGSNGGSGEVGAGVGAEAASAYTRARAHAAATATVMGSGYHAHVGSTADAASVTDTEDGNGSAYDGTAGTGTGAGDAESGAVAGAVDTTVLERVTVTPQMTPRAVYTAVLASRSDLAPAAAERAAEVAQAAARLSPARLPSAEAQVRALNRQPGTPPVVPRRYVAPLATSKAARMSAQKKRQAEAGGSAGSSDAQSP